MKATRTDQEFPPRRDAWLLVLIVISMSAALVGTVVAAINEPPETRAGFLAAPVLAMLAAAAMIAWVWRDTGYRLGRSALHVRSGPVRRRVEYVDILEVRHSRLPLSGPALSLRRLRIKRRRRGWRRLLPAKPLMIAPRDREGFIRSLARRCPHLHEQDGVLMPREPASH